MTSNDFVISSVYVKYPLAEQVKMCNILQNILDKEFSIKDERDELQEKNHNPSTLPKRTETDGSTRVKVASGKREVSLFMYLLNFPFANPQQTNQREGPVVPRDHTTQLTFQYAKATPVIAINETKMIICWSINKCSPLANYPSTSTRHFLFFRHQRTAFRTQ